MKRWIRGITRLFWHQVADEVRGGKLEVVLEDEEYPPLAPDFCIRPTFDAESPCFHGLCGCRDCDFAGLAKASGDLPQALFHHHLVVKVSRGVFSFPTPAARWSSVQSQRSAGLLGKSRSAGSPE
jgi:hypothetical protein